MYSIEVSGDKGVAPGDTPTNPLIDRFEKLVLVNA
jgi:hypothetical protein